MHTLYIQRPSLTCDGDITMCTWPPKARYYSFFASLNAWGSQEMREVLKLWIKELPEPLRDSEKVRLLLAMEPLR